MFSQNEQALLRAVIDRIMPADDFPPASGLGALDYILPMLSGDSAADAEPIRYGLQEFDRAGFLGKSPSEQDAMLASVETASWFRRLVELTAEGVYADPSNGGNRDTAGWRMIGFPGARYDYRDYVAKHGQKFPLPPVALQGRPGWNVQEG